MDPVRVILVCGDTPSRKVYLDRITAFGAVVDVVETFKELYARLSENRYNGILIDLVSNMRAPKSDKRLVYKAVDDFPVVQVKHDPQKNTIGVLFFGQSKVSSTLDDFLKNECFSFKARTIQIVQRKEIHLNILLSRSASFDKKQIVKTVTMDLSDAGCFLFTTGEWSEDETVWVIIRELNDKTPMACQVKRVLKWGEETQIPGIDVSFKKITEDQSKELKALL